MAQSTSMSGTSADNLADLEGELREQVTGDPQRATTMAEELSSVASMLHHEVALRRYLTDTSMPTQARRDLAGQVLGGRVGEPTASLVSSTVAQRWSAGADLARALEHLAAVAAVRSAGNDSERLLDELFVVDQAVRHSAPLRDALSDPARSAADKQSLVHDLLAAQALEATQMLTVQAITGTHRTVGVALAEFQGLAAAVHGERVATVRVAHPLTDEDTRRLERALARQYDREVHLNLVIDPDVIGGVRVEIGDEVIDGTLASRLSHAQRRLAGNPG